MFPKKRKMMIIKCKLIALSSRKKLVFSVTYLTIIYRMLGK
jgi:hypothetical protein